MFDWRLSYCSEIIQYLIMSHYIQTRYSGIVHVLRDIASIDKVLEEVLSFGFLWTQVLRLRAHEYPSANWGQQRVNMKANRCSQA